MAETNWRELCTQLVDAFDLVELREAPEQWWSALGAITDALAQPVADLPQRPECFDFALDFLGGPENDDLLAYIQQLEAIAADRARRPGPVPVPVSERLPGAGDCAPWPDEPGEAPWCWVFVKDLLDEDSWDRRPVTCLTCHPPMYTHWLPAHALPLPGGEGSDD